MKSLEGLEGASNVKSTEKDEFELTLKPGAKLAPSAIKAVLPAKYSVDEMKVTVTAELAGPEKEGETGVRLVLLSGQKVALANRKAKDDKDKVEDVVGKLAEALKSGSKAARVEGVLVEDKDGNLTLQAAKGEGLPTANTEKK